MSVFAAFFSCFSLTLVVSYNENMKDYQKYLNSIKEKVQLENRANVIVGMVRDLLEDIVSDSEKKLARLEKEILKVIKDDNKNWK